MRSDLTPASMRHWLLRGAALFAVLLAGVGCSPDRFDASQEKHTGAPPGSAANNVHLDQALRRAGSEFDGVSVGSPMIGADTVLATLYVGDVVNGWALLRYRTGSGMELEWWEHNLEAACARATKEFTEDQLAEVGCDVSGADGAPSTTEADIWPYAGESAICTALPSERVEQIFNYPIVDPEDSEPYQRPHIERNEDGSAQREYCGYYYADNPVGGVEVWITYDQSSGRILGSHDDLPEIDIGEEGHQAGRVLSFERNGLLVEVHVVEGPTDIESKAQELARELDELILDGVRGPLPCDEWAYEPDCLAI